MYEHVTRFIDDIERGVPGGDIEVPLTHALYEPQIVDVNYFETLEANGLGGPDAPWQADVESLDLKTTVALLTFVHRADHHQGWGLMCRMIDEGFVYRILLRLRELDEGRRRPDFIPFFSETEWYGCFSNWHFSGFEFRGTAFSTSEHWMMWQKARVMGDGAAAQKILAAPHPSVAKGLGGSVAHYDDKLWDAVREQLVYYGVREKFLQNARDRNLLLSTGSALLAEANPKDRVWSIGLSVNDPDAETIDKWPGRNLLGRVLMRVRADIRAGSVFWFTSEAAVCEMLDSQLGSMTLLQLSRVPVARAAVLTYARVCLHLFGLQVGIDGFLAGSDLSLKELDEALRDSNAPLFTPVAWDETLAELALQWKLGRL